MSCLSLLFLPLASLSKPKRKPLVVGYIGKDLDTLTNQIATYSKINIFPSLLKCQKYTHEHDSYNIVVDKQNIILLVFYKD